MSTNRTKTDWAYKAAQKIVIRAITANASERLEVLREIASILRRAEHRGCLQERAEGWNRVRRLEGEIHHS